MKKTSNSLSAQDNAVNEMPPEYHFDYSKAKPNRFAETAPEKTISIILDPDVAEVFTTSESVNKALRAILSAIPTPVE
jgi:hypothetical protein